MNDGFILLHRKILDWQWYSNKNDRLVWFHCLLSANWKDGYFEGKLIPRGSFVTSYDKLAKDIGITTQQVRTSLNHLKLTNEITHETNHQFSIITINNYNKYQVEQQTNQQTINKRLTNEQQTINNNRINNNKSNNSKKEINKETISKDIEKKYFESLKVNTIFNEFLELRKKLKAVNTDRAINMLINKLNKYDEETQYKMIEQSIVSSWKDVYELKDKKQKGYSFSDLLKEEDYE